MSGAVEPVFVIEPIDIKAEVSQAPQNRKKQMDIANIPYGAVSHLERVDIFIVGLQGCEVRRGSMPIHSREYHSLEPGQVLSKFRESQAGVSVSRNVRIVKGRNVVDVVVAVIVIAIVIVVARVHRASCFGNITIRLWTLAQQTQRMGDLECFERPGRAQNRAFKRLPTTVGAEDELTIQADPGALYQVLAKLSAIKESFLIIEPIKVIQYTELHIKRKSWVGHRYEVVRRDEGE